MSAPTFDAHPEWERDGGWTGLAEGTDPNDELFGDVVEDVSLESAGAADAVFVGEPFDRAVVGRRGAGEGPVAIRRSLANTKTHHFDRGQLRSIGDLGDVETLLGALEESVTDVRPADSIEAIQDRLCETTAAVHGVDALPVFLGGDNSLTYPNAAPLLKDGTLGCINLDAHLDVREVREDASSGTPYRQLFEAGLDAYACVGARHFETSSAYHDYVRGRGGEIVTAEEVGADPVEAADLALEAMDGVDRVYVSVDVDVLDATAAPGVSAPTPGGITTRELYRLLRLLAGDERIAGFEVVECAPPLDADGETSDATARAVAHFLAGYLEGRR